MAEVCNPVKKKSVHFCDEFNQVFLITPQQGPPRRRDHANSKTQKVETVSQVDLNMTMDFETVAPADESCFIQPIQKIETHLKTPIQVNNKCEPEKLMSRSIYYDEVKDRVKPKLVDSKTMSVRTIRDYMERISDLESDLWSNVFMPTKPYLSDINNNTMVMIIDWLKSLSIQIFQSNHADEKVRDMLKATDAFEQEEKIIKKKEPLVAVIYGLCGSGKTQLVRCAAEHMGFGILNLSVGERRDKATIEKTTKDVEKKLAGAHGGQAEFKLPLIFLDDADVYFETDTGYLECLHNLIRTTQVPVVLTTSSRDFAKNLHVRFDESQIWITALDFTDDQLVLQMQHFVSALFMLDLSDEGISNIIKASGFDIRSALNIFQFFYSPIIMRPLYERDLPKKLFDVPSPVVEAPKTRGDARDLAELGYGLHRSGLIDVGSSFIDGIGYVDENMEENYSGLSETLTEMYHDLTSEYDSAPKPASSLEEARWW